MVRVEGQREFAALSLRLLLRPYNNLPSQGSREPRLALSTSELCVPIDAVKLQMRQTMRRSSGGPLPRAED